MRNYLHILNDIILTWVIYLLQVKSLVLAVDTRQTDFVVSHEVNDVGCIANPYMVPQNIHFLAVLSKFDTFYYNILLLKDEEEIC
jgi:hypothetical protein